MNSRLIIVCLLVLALGFAFFQNARTSSEIRELKHQNDTLRADHELAIARWAEAERHLSALDTLVTSRPERTEASITADSARLAALEAQLRAVSNAIAQVGSPTSVRRPGSSAPAIAADPNDPQLKRPWGPEQAVGPPNTERAGDYQTAWASLEPDGGPEWLSVVFERAVQPAEIRIRESFNPGAITKVTALIGSRETVLWSGIENPGEAPCDFTVAVTERVTVQNVIIYIDSLRVRGWNEIDAVELVGRDGSRQWAAAAMASSTYADRTSGRTAEFTTLSR